MKIPKTDQTSSSLSSPKFIPSEILTDIITRLPSESLVRFGAVSKFWYSFIRNPNFITNHLNRSLLTSNACLLLMPSKFKKTGNNCCSILSEKTLIELSNFEIPWPLYSNSRRPSKFSNDICFCNGVICISGNYRASNKLYLCNPSLRKLKILPPSCIDVAPFGRFESVFGFGVDNVSADYKVVRIFYDSWSEVMPMVEVYSLRSDSWKRVELNSNVPYIDNDDMYLSSVLCNGAIHWFAKAFFDNRRMILCFDLCDEVFHEMELPVGLETVWRGGYVFLFKESLSLFMETDIAEGLLYEVWIMKEYGVVESWTKEFTGFIKGVHKSEVGFCKSGKVILRKHDGMLTVLDLESGRLKDIGFHEKSYRVADYMESLVLLEDGVSFRAQSGLVRKERDGGRRSSAVEVEEGDANWRAAIDSAASSSLTNDDANWKWKAAISSSTASGSPTNEIPISTQIWEGEWETS